MQKNVKKKFLNWQIFQWKDLIDELKDNQALKEITLFKKDIKVKITEP